MSVYGVTMKTVRVVSLPRELQTSEDVKRFMKDILGLDCLRVKIVDMRSESGVCFRSAFVDIDTQQSDSVTLNAMTQPGGHAIQSGCIPGGIHFDNGKPMGHVRVLGVKSRSKPSLEKLYADSQRSNESYRATIEKLKAEITELKKYSVVPIPGMSVSLDVGYIIAENHRLKEEIQRIKA
jgi:hypothetical protein